MWVVLYIASIVAVNWLFVSVPPLSTPFGSFYLATVVVGLVFVLRDYAQREIGNKILLATLVAGIITWYMTSPELAIASLTAFFIAEMADWAVFSFSRRPLQSRILVSSLIAVPLDTLAFLYISGYLTPVSFSTEILSKAVGVGIVWYLLKLRENSKQATAV